MTEKTTFTAYFSSQAKVRVFTNDLREAKKNSRVVMLYANHFDQYKIVDTLRGKFAIFAGTRARLRTIEKELNEE